MMRRWKSFRMGLLVVAATGLLLAGCGKGGYSGPTGTVEGKATLAGQPLPEGCTVMFVAGEGQVASGKVGAGGVYRLTSGGKPAIPAMKYNACVTPPPAAQMSQDDYDKVMSGKGEPPKPAATVAIPGPLQSASTSGLSYEVKSGPNTINIDLK